MEPAYSNSSEGLLRKMSLQPHTQAMHIATIQIAMIIAPSIINTTANGLANNIAITNKKIITSLRK